MKKKVLLIHESQLLQKLWVKALQKCADIICAFSIEEARTKLENEPGFDVIVVSARLSSEEVNTESLVRDIRAKFAGHIVAASAYANDRKRLMKAGCSHESNMVSVPLTILEIFGLVKISQKGT